VAVDRRPVLGFDHLAAAPDFAAKIDEGIEDVAGDGGKPRAAWRRTGRIVAEVKAAGCLIVRRPRRVVEIAVKGALVALITVAVIRRHRIGIITVFDERRVL